ncbi:MAG: hypothetical protein NFCOHLIN_00368 [Gammaproteobacteria bacterium]|nr:hypothetical protein [Gammaproteobacteria bacterium]
MALRPSRTGYLAVALIAGLGLGPAAHAAPIVLARYEFNSLTAPASVTSSPSGANVAVSTLSAHGMGATGSLTHGTNPFSGVPPYSYFVNDDVTDNAFNAANDYLSFTLTPFASTTTLTSLSFIAKRDSVSTPLGNSTIQLRARIGNGALSGPLLTANINSGSWQAVSYLFGGSAFEGVSDPIEFRLYFADPTSVFTREVNNVTFTIPYDVAQFTLIDNLTVNGAVVANLSGVPVPAPVLLLASALATLAALGHRPAARS